MIGFAGVYVLSQSSICSICFVFTMNDFPHLSAPRCCVADLADWLVDLADSSSMLTSVARTCGH